MTTVRNVLKMAVALAVLTSGVATAQEIAAPLRREHLSTVNMLIDNVYTSSLREGNVNYRASKTLTMDASFMLPVYETARWQWAAGLGWKRRELKYADQPPLPGVLQEGTVPIVATVELAEFSTLSIHAKPGLYFDNYDVGISDVNVPVGVRLFTEHSQELLTIVGLQLDWMNEIPIIPDIGVRWYFWYDWVLDFRLPNPRIEYEINDAWKVHVGMEWLGGGYRVSKYFGNSVGRPALNDTTLTYRDIRIKAGVDWAWDEDSYFAVAGGWSLKRQYVYGDGDLQLATRGAPFVQWMFRTSW